MGEYGPIYEVIVIESPNAVTIREVESERITCDYPVTDFQTDLIE